MNRSAPMKRSPMPPRTAGLRSSPAAAKAVGQRRHTPRDTGPDRKTRQLVLERDGYACVCCGRSIIGQFYSLQHRQARGAGGDSSVPNLITMLGSGTTGCHGRVESRLHPEDHAKGYWLDSGQDPAAEPVMLFSEHGSGITAWLTADGGYAFEAPVTNGGRS